MSNNTKARHNGIIQTLATMPAGIAVTKQAITKTIGNNARSPNKHHNLRWQHHHPQQRRNNRRQQYILCQKDVNTNGINTSVSPTGRDEAEADIMIEGGAATHVCPAWFARDSPMYTLQHGQAATENKGSTYS